MSHGAAHLGLSLALTLLRSRPPPWCSGVLVSDALLVFSLLLLGSLSLIMSYWRQKRAMTPGGTKEGSRSPCCLLHAQELLSGTELQMASHLHYHKCASGLWLLQPSGPLPASPFNAAGLVLSTNEGPYYHHLGVRSKDMDAELR